MPAPLTISSDRVLTDAGLTPATISIENGCIASLTPGASATALDLSGLVILPGLVDTHVHVNEPGRTEWEGFESATRAAAAGGITTIVAMPLNCTPAATTCQALLAEAQAAAGTCTTDYAFWGGLVPGNSAHLAPMWNAGALGFKCFLSPSGVDDFQNVARRHLEDAAPILTQLDAPLLVHAEDPALLPNADIVLRDRPRSYAAYLATRPPQAEVSAIELLINLSRRHNTRTHIVHLATEQALPILIAARRADLPISVETCPHYLSFAAEDIEDGQPLFKCAPPIRSRTTREALWAALTTRHIDLIASDHSPCPPSLKSLDTGDFSKAWGGISSLQLSLPAAWSQAHARGLSLADIARWMSTNPAKLAGLQTRKGRIAPGLDADLIALDPDATFSVDQSALHHRHKPTPYHGLTLRGIVHKTFLRGQLVFDRAQSSPFPQDKPGQWLKRIPN